MNASLKIKRVGLYARVSTSGQDVENQLSVLRLVAEKAGWVVVDEYVDHGISGANGRDKRPEFDRLLKDVTRRKVDLVAVWSVDRLGRSLQDLVGFLGELKGAGCDLYLDRQGVDTSTAAGHALFGMMGVFAEFERAMIRERVIAGQAKARSKGKKIGRPKVDDGKEGQIRALRADGYGIRRIAKELGCGVSVVQRVLAP